MKTLIVGDIHLWEKELSTTKGMVQSSVDMLNGIKQAIIDDTEICNVVFEGDIQHATPKSIRTLRETTIWKSILEDIGNIISERCPKYVIVTRDRDNVIKEPTRKLPLFSVKGNHDVEKRMKSSTNDYTFFDDLLYTGVIQNPRGFMFKDSGRVYYIQLNNYGEVSEPIAKEVLDLKDDNIVKIKILHDTIKVPTSPTWFNMLSEDEYYIGESVLGDCSLAVCGHIHEPLEPVAVQGDGTLGTKKTIYVQTGAMGRTSFTDDNMRDYGYCTLVDTTDGLRVEQLKIPLMPVEDYFNWKKIHLNDVKKEAIKKGQMFNLDFGKTELRNTDPKIDIQQLDIDTDIKENCIDAINRVEEEQ